MAPIVCPNCCFTSEVKLKPYLIISGFFIAIVGFIDMVINAIVYATLTNYHFGAWWSGVLTFLCGILGLTSIRRGIVVTACVLSIISIFVCLAAMIVDSIGSNLMTSIVTCASTSNEYAAYAYSYYGNPSYETSCLNCIEQYYSSKHSCYCVDSESNCYFFDGISDCNKIFTTYTPNLAVSVTFDTLCFALVFLFSVLTSFSICCPYGFRKKAPTFRNELSRNGKADSVRNPIREAAPSGSDKGLGIFFVNNGLARPSSVARKDYSSRAVTDRVGVDHNDIESGGHGSTRKLSFSQRISASFAAFSHAEGGKNLKAPVSKSHTLPATTSKESIELKKITTAQPETTDNSVTSPSTEGKVNRRSSISRKRVPPLPPTDTGASSSPKSNDVKEMEVNSPVPQVASLMKVFNQFPVEEEGITQRDFVDNSFSQNYSSSSLVAKRNTSDEAFERELREMKKDLDAFQPTQPLDK